MSAESQADTTISRIGAIGREMADRRALRDSNMAAAKQESEQNLRNQGRIADKLGERLNELARRQQKSGGWATEQTMSDRNHIMGLGVQQDGDEDTRRVAELSGRSQPARQQSVPAAEPPRQGEHSTPAAETASKTSADTGSEPARPQPEYPETDEDEGFGGAIMQRR